MATAKRSRSARRSVMQTPTGQTVIKNKKPKKEEPTYTAADIRKIFPAAKAEVVVRFKQDVLIGSINDVSARLSKLAKANGLSGTWKIARRSFTTSSRYGYRSSTTDWALVGFRPYSDEELVAEGPKLLKKENDRRTREYNAELRKVKKFNQLAATVGQPLIEEPKKPELLKL